MMQQDWFRAGLFALSTALAAGAATAQERVGTTDYWGTFVQDTSGGKVCWIASAPIKTDGDVSGRGDAYLMVSYRPADNVREGEVSLISGYTFAPGSKATVSVDGGRDYVFFSGGDGAWLEKAEEEAGLITAMRRGSVAKVTGTASGRVIDEFSLKGFTAASRAARKACGI